MSWLWYETVRELVYELYAYAMQDFYADTVRVKKPIPDRCTTSKR